MSWSDLQVSANELRPSFSLNTGQCFNWRNIGKNKQGLTWLGMIDNVPLMIMERERTTEFMRLLPNTELTNTEGCMSDDDLHNRLRQYFQLDKSLGDLYTQWSTSCPRMAVIASHLKGVQVVQQDPWECLISFICSSNNNIARITQMLDKLRYHYGEYKCTVVVDTETNSVGVNNWHVTVDPSMTGLSTPNGPVFDTNIKSINGRPVFPSLMTTAVTNTVHHLFTFPTPESLAAVTEGDLRELGMGYRAKFIIKTAQMVAEKPGGGQTWLQSLRHCGRQTGSGSGMDIVKREPVVVKSEPCVIKSETVDSMSDVAQSNSGSGSAADRQFVQRALLEFPGVGPKVADCIALFSLNQCGTVPVDTHVWSIAARDYAPELLLNTKSTLTPAVHEAIGNVFRGIFGEYAGWAHSVLFAAELPDFRRLLPAAMQDEMKVFADNQRDGKKALKAAKEESKRAKMTAMESAPNGAVWTPTKNRKKKE